MVGDGGLGARWGGLDLADGGAASVTLVGEVASLIARGEAGIRDDDDTCEGSPGRSIVGLAKIESPSRGAGDFGETSEGEL